MADYWLLRTFKMIFDVILGQIIFSDGIKILISFWKELNFLINFLVVLKIELSLFCGQMEASSLLLHFNY